MRQGVVGDDNPPVRLAQQRLFHQPEHVFWRQRRWLLNFLSLRQHGAPDGIVVGRALGGFGFIELMGEGLDLLRQIYHQPSESVGGVGGQQFTIDTDEAFLDGQKSHQRPDKDGLPRTFWSGDTGHLPVSGDK